MFLKPASGSEFYHEFIACIKIETRIGIGILMRYRNCYNIWYRPITNKKHYLPISSFMNME